MRSVAAPLLKFTLLLLLGLSVSACGFHLRGSVTLSPMMARTYVEAGQSVELAAELSDLLQSSGAQLVTQRLEAKAVIKLLGEQRQRRVIAVDSNGAASAYELSYQASFELLDGDGAVLMARQLVSRSRDLSYDSGNVLGKSREEEQTYRALRAEVAAAILQRIQYGLPRESK